MYKRLKVPMIFPEQSNSFPIKRLKFIFTVNDAIMPFVMNMIYRKNSISFNRSNSKIDRKNLWKCFYIFINLISYPHNVLVWE